MQPAIQVNNLLPSVGREMNTGQGTVLVGREVNRRSNTNHSSGFNGTVRKETTV